MLQENEIKKILGLIKQRKTNYRIWKETGYSVNTIATIRKNSLNTETTQIQEEDIPYTNPIDKTQGILADIDSLIQTGHLDDKDRKIWEKRAEQIREIVRVEVDDRISSERADAVEKRDQEWIKIVEQNYVKKEVATGLKSTIREREATITSLGDVITEIDEAYLKDQTFIMNLLRYGQIMQNQIQCLSNDKTFLEQQNWNLYNCIENRLDEEVRQGQEQLRHDREVFNDEKTRFTIHEAKQQLNLNSLFFDGDQRQKAVEIREKHLAEREEEQQKRENEFEEYKNGCEKRISEIITGIKTNVDKIAEVYCEKLVKRSFDKQINEIAAEWKKINDQKEQITKKQEVLKKTAEEQKTEEDRLQKLEILLEKTQEKQKCIIVHPETCSGVPVVQSGFSPG